MSKRTRRNPIKGPGKFEGETYVAKWVYETSDGGIGDVDGPGWYDYYSGKIKGRGPFHLIVSEDSQGFVSATFYDTKAQMEKAWARVERGVDRFYDEQDSE